MLSAGDSWCVKYDGTSSCKPQRCYSEGDSAGSSSSM